MFEIIISIIVISLLIIFHELGHHLSAKKFGVKVEEFGLGLPPRLYGKKIGETIWSLNWIPFGGFVRMQGMGEEEREKVDQKRSFNTKPVWQRMLIVAAGCLVFWLLAVSIFFFIFVAGTSVTIDDYKIEPNAIVKIVEVGEESPAQLAGVEAGDIIEEIHINKEYAKINKIADVQNIFQRNPGGTAIIYIRRSNDLLTKKIILDDQDSKIGVALIRIVPNKSFSISEAILMSLEKTYNSTILITQGLFGVIDNLIIGEEVVDIAGPVRIVGIMGGTLEFGVTHFLSFVALISINLAILNLLPIPGFDGGRLMFLIYEGIRKKPFPQKIENYATGFFLILLMSLMLIVTIGEIRAML